MGSGGVRIYREAFRLYVLVVRPSVQLRSVHMRFISLDLHAVLYSMLRPPSPHLLLSSAYSPLKSILLQRGYRNTSVLWHESRLSSSPLGPPTLAPSTQHCMPNVAISFAYLTLLCRWPNPPVLSFPHAHVAQRSEDWALLSHGCGSLAAN